MARRLATALAALVLLLAAACAPEVQRFGPATVEPALAEAALSSVDGRELPMRRWLPPAGVPVRAAVAALHGFNDYGAAFRLPAEWWAERGIATYAIDQRGFGAGPRPGIWGGAEALVADARGLATAVRQRHPEVPVYLLGESMGGAVAVAALAGWDRPPVDGAVLVAPAVWGGEAMHPALRAAVWLGAHTMPWNPLTGEGLGRVASDNIEMLRGLGRDPLVIKRTRTDAVYGLTRLMAAAQAAAPDVAVPLLLLYGGNDQIVPQAPVARLAGRLRAPTRLAFYPDGYHMLLRDLAAERAWRDVAAWLVDREGALPSGQEVEPSTFAREAVAADG